MKLLDKIKNQLDFTNYYSIKRTVGILESEFAISVKNGNAQHAREIFKITKDIYDDLTSSYRESEDYGSTMSFIQKVWAKRLRSFLAFMQKKITDDLGIGSIKDLVNEN